MTDPSQYKPFWARLFTILIRTQESLTEHDEKRAARMLVADGVLVIGMATLQGGVFLSAFALALGASNYEIGLITTIVLVSQLMQLPGLALVNQFRRRRILVVLFAGLSRLLWIPIIFIPVLFVDKGVTFLLQWLVLAAIVGAMAAPPWNSLLRDIVPLKKMGGVFSKRLAMGTALALAVTLGGGYFIDWWGGRFPQGSLYGYSMLFTVGLVFGIVSLVAVGRLPEKTMATDKAASWTELLLMPLKDPNFRKLIWFFCVWSFALNMAAPFFIIYMLDRVGLSLFMVTLLTVVSQLVNLLFLGIWGRLADRFTNKSVLSVSCPLFLVAILTWSFTTMPERYVLTIPLIFLIQVIGGASIAGVSIGATNIAFKLCPEDKAHSYVTVFGLTAALAGSVAPLIGGIIADFFAQRNLSLPIQWSGPGGELSIFVLSFKALDFLFFFTFLIGLLSLRYLKRVEEQGEVTEQVVVNGLLNEVIVPLRSFASIEGVRRLSLAPVTMLLRIARKRNGR